MVLKAWAQNAKEGEPRRPDFSWVGTGKKELAIHGVRVSADGIGTVAKKLLKEIEEDLQDLTFKVAFGNKSWREILTTNQFTNNTNDPGWSPFPDHSETLLQAIFANQVYRSKICPLFVFLSLPS